MPKKDGLTVVTAYQFLISRVVYLLPNFGTVIVRICHRYRCYNYYIPNWQLLVFSTLTSLTLSHGIIDFNFLPKFCYHKDKLGTVSIAPLRYNKIVTGKSPDLLSMFVFPMLIHLKRNNIAKNRYLPENREKRNAQPVFERVFKV